MNELELKFKKYCKETNCYSQCELKTLCDIDKPRSSEAFVAFILLEYQKREQNFKKEIKQATEKAREEIFKQSVFDISDRECITCGRRYYYHNGLYQCICGSVD